MCSVIATAVSSLLRPVADVRRDRVKHTKPTRIFRSVDPARLVLSGALPRRHHRRAAEDGAVQRGLAHAAIRRRAQTQPSTSRVAPLAAAAQDGSATSKKLAVWVSGGGSNLKALHAATQDGRIAGEVVVVVSDKPGCGGWSWAEEQGIPTYAFPAKKGETGLSAAEIVGIMQAAGVDYVLLAGFLKLVPGEVVKAFPQAVLNIHPALLPAFGGKGYYGMNVHKAVVASGARFSGPTVHFIDEEYDKGTIVAQRPVPVYPTDTPEEVAARVLKQEHIVFAEVVGALCRGDYEFREDGVIKLRAGAEDGVEWV